MLETFIMSYSYLIPYKLWVGARRWSERICDVEDTPD